MPATYIKISDQLLADVIGTAFEGGSTGWCNSAFNLEGDIDPANTSPWYAQGGFWADSDFKVVVTPIEDGSEDDPITITWSVLHANFKKFAAAHPTSMSRIAEEQYDAIDADRLWQFIVFGELVYG